jgi:hypothetical protein
VFRLSYVFPLGAESSGAVAGSMAWRSRSRTMARKAATDAVAAS